MPGSSSNKPPAVDPAKSGSSRGTRVVVALVILGIAAGVLTVSYWSMQGRWMRRTAQRSARQDAGSARWDQNAADVELNKLRQAFEKIVSGTHQAGALVDAIRRLVQRYPQYAATRTLLGQVLLYDDQPDAAYQQLSLSLELDGQQPEVHLLAGTIAYQLERIDQATGHYSTAVGIDPSNPRYRLHLAQAYISQQRDNEARDVLLEALRMDSSLHAAYASLADLYARQNRLVLALTQIQKAIEHTGESEQDKQVFYYRQKSRLLRRDNRPEEALLTLKRLEMPQIDLAVIEDMATCWSMLGKPEQAAMLFEDAMVADPTRSALVAGAVRWRIKAGDQETARRHLALLRRINPRSDMATQLEGQLD